ncbi:MAG: DUF72 domain-containing protein [Thermodesulfobacterium geofontis]|uniref:DUF72 domain-containing protein n=1 Tax=Thermodesulfobacterium geofontis TaxID=1295609 RepID=A0A2N7PPX9_9BACT|nr:MAG: DUF72 domain-containing protein [Thermodesulfobacterium geofontis]
MKVKYYIGTCGWSYYSFKSYLYPQESKPREWLKIYSQYFNTVEINATFYKIPTPKTFKKWYEETPENFVFSVKIPKTITHLKKLKDVKDDLNSFLKAISPLKEKGKVLLFQFPPSFKYEREVLENFLKILPSDYLNVVEIRNITFHNEEFTELLKKYKVCLCFSDCAGKYPSWYEVQTVDYLYIRLHGSKKLYVSNYEEEELQRLAEKIKVFKVKTAYIYFDNTAEGYAVPNALRLREILEA